MIDQVENIAKFSKELNSLQEKFSFAHISQFTKWGFNPSMDSKQIRLKNMLSIIAKGGSAAAFAEMVSSAS